jgi:putative phosphoesterase
MRVALVSDIHANEHALRAVLDDVERVGTDLVVCLGDVATLGPRPNAVIEIIAELGCPCIMGNHDEFLVDPGLIHSYSPAKIVLDSVEWCGSRLNGEERAFLAGFERTIEIPLSGSADLLLFHGSPRSHMENLLATTPADAVDEALGGRRATIMAGGHTHIQMLRQHRGAYLLNPGSVGLPFKEFADRRTPTVMAHAEYATVEAHGAAVDIVLRRVPLEKRLLREAIAATDNPIRLSLEPQYAD